MIVIVVVLINLVEVETEKETKVEKNAIETTKSPLNFNDYLCNIWLFLQDYKKTMKVTWLCDRADSKQADVTRVVCVHYDNLVTKPVLAKDEDFKQFINRESEVCIL